MLIRYKNRLPVNVNLIMSLYQQDYTGIIGTTTYKKEIALIFFTERKNELSWIFDTEQERDNVYKYILDTYFTDIEKQINKSEEKSE